MRIFVFYRDSLPGAGDRNPPKVAGVGFTHVATLNADASVPADVLERTFREMNVVDGTEVPTFLRNRSMSVGDVLKFEDGSAFVCASIGFVKVDTAGADLQVRPFPEVKEFPLTH